jgi:cyclopropane fatty-acyl-phospholipid synthase-like methyltransferase
VLDVGCGMGGLSNLLLKKGFSVEALTPNKDQKRYLAEKYPKLTCHHCKFEDLSTDRKFGTIINSESLQYIPLAAAFEKAGSIMLPGGRWIIADYFRIQDDESDRTPHAADDFLRRASKNGWRTVTSIEITPHVLPTLRLVYLYANRFALPVTHFAFEKLRYKQGWLYYLTTALRASIMRKIEKEVATINPERFVADRKYMLFVLEKLPAPHPG